MEEERVTVVRPVALTLRRAPSRAGEKKEGGSLKARNIRRVDFSTSCFRKKIAESPRSAFCEKQNERSRRVLPDPSFPRFRRKLPGIEQQHFTTDRRRFGKGRRQPDGAENESSRKRLVIMPVPPLSAFGRE